jgi:hypothetical protein
MFSFLGVTLWAIILGIASNLLTAVLVKVAPKTWARLLALWASRKDIWNSTKSRMTALILPVAFLALPLLGAALLFLGIQLDNQGFWNDRTLLANLYSALTGGLFSIPLCLFALLGLQEHSQDPPSPRDTDPLA